VPTPNLRCLQAFRRVVELHSFNAAARRLEMTSGAVSKQVAQLERDIGARLLNRTTRSVAITEEGAAYYDAVARVLDDVEMAGEQARSKSALPSGSLKVSVPASFGMMWLASRLPDFLERFPLVKLDIALNDRFVDLVQEGFDCAIRIATQLPDSQLVARPLGKVDRLLVASPRYLKKAPGLSSPEDLRAHDCLVYSQTATPNEWPLTGTKLGKPIEVSGRFRVNNSVMLREAVVRGHGITLTPRFVVDDLLKKRSLVEVLREHRPAPHNIYGIIAQQRYVPCKVRVFLDFVEERLAKS
jgi:DNA-binding transcriptional LysR family regulator